MFPWAFQFSRQHWPPIFLDKVLERVFLLSFGFEPMSWHLEAWKWLKWHMRKCDGGEWWRSRFKVLWQFSGAPCFQATELGQCSITLGHAAHEAWVDFCCVVSSRSAKSCRRPLVLFHVVLWVSLCSPVYSFAHLLIATMEAQQFDFSASQADWDFGDGTDNASQPEVPPPPTSSDRSDRSPKRRRLSKGSGKGGDGKMCAVCEVEPCVVKFNYCKECKKDVQSCLNNAKADGKEDDFKRLSKTSAGLKHLIAHYKSKCPSRGQGVPRDKMDWVSYLSSVFTENRQVNGEKEVFMDFPDFEQFCKSKGKTAKDALEEWSDMEAQGRDHDFKGRKDFEKRFAVVTEEYRLKEKVNGDRQEPGGLGRVCFFGECMCFTLLCNFTWQWRLVSILDGVSFLRGRPCRLLYFGVSFLRGRPGRLVLLWCVIFTWQALAGWFFFGVSFFRGRPW